MSQPAPQLTPDQGLAALAAWRKSRLQVKEPIPLLLDRRTADRLGLPYFGAGASFAGVLCIHRCPSCGREDTRNQPGHLNCDGCGTPRTSSPANDLGLRILEANGFFRPDPTIPLKLVYGFNIIRRDHLPFATE
jgi:hypothetical protein